MTPTHPHPAPPPAADTVTAPATPTPLDVVAAHEHLYDGQCPDFMDHVRRDPLCPACRALDTVTALVGAALAQDPPASAALASAAAAYRAWAPSPDTARDG